MATPSAPKGATPSNILDLTPEEAKDRLVSWGKARDLPRYRAEQLFPRLWQRPVGSWSDATELPKELRVELEKAFPSPGSRSIPSRPPTTAPRNSSGASPTERRSSPF